MDIFGILNDNNIHVSLRELHSEKKNSRVRIKFYTRLVNLFKPRMNNIG